VNNFKNYFTKFYKNFIDFCIANLSISKEEFNSLMGNSSNIKKRINSNAQAELNRQIAEKKAINNATAKRIKNKANAEAKHRLNANLAKQTKCESAWTEYNDYKNKHPMSYKMFGPKKPSELDCDPQKYRLKKIPLNKPS
jgi:hypothetical protein